MKKALILLFIFLSGNFSLMSQEQRRDVLDIAFHKEKRAEVLAKMPENSVAVFFANPVRNRANDVDYVYHQDPNFFYLTGNNEPNSMLLLFSEPIEGTQEILFVQPRNARMELYNGARLGVDGAKEKLGFDVVYETTEFKEFALNFTEFDKVLFFQFHNDVRDNQFMNGDLYDIIKQFKGKAQIPDNYNPMVLQIHETIRTLEESEREDYRNRLKQASSQYAFMQEDPIIQNFINAEGSLEQEKIVGNIMPSAGNLDTETLVQIMTDLREVKTSEEIDLLRKAVYISCMGQVEVMKGMHPNMSEGEIQGIQEFVFKKYGSEYEGYPSIVGAGHNGCVLHYIDNNKENVGEDLVLMDLGAEYRGYTADVTRTIPANGKFTTEQKLIYDLVLKAQEESFKVCKPGESIRSTTQISQKVIAEGLIELGIIEDASEVRKYFPHGVSHHIGLDVHDPGNYENFEKDMVLTVEPGIYIPDDSPCDPKWWGIAVRIEDDILITEDGYELLSGVAPRTTEAIEAMMAQPSIFKTYTLPSLDEAVKD